MQRPRDLGTKPLMPAAPLAGDGLQCGQAAADRCGDGGTADPLSNELGLMGSSWRRLPGSTESLSALPCTLFCAGSDPRAAPRHTGQQVQSRHLRTHHRQSRQDWANWCVMEVLLRLLLLPTICILQQMSICSFCLNL